jgi:hypothetical protein
MPKGQKGAKAPRQMREKELASIREDLGPEVGEELRRAVRLATSVARLIGEIDRLKKALAERDERLERIAGATKRPTKKRGPRKAKAEVLADRVPDSTDPAQTEIPGAASGSVFPDGGPTS